jgi:hypothetical protein
MRAMQKYPRTHHIEGSRLQAGDEDLDNVPFTQIQGRHLVVEEKLDGANAGISFDESGRLWLQSRGHFLTGGARERQFNLFKQWANTHAAALHAVLGDRYTLYGEWLYAKHTVFYDQLPHYFFEFDVLDSETGEFLSTPRRQELLAGVPIVSVPVLWSGTATSHRELLALVKHSLYKSKTWRETLQRVGAESGVSPQQVLLETDGSDLMEGLYLKVEEEGRVVERYKYVRGDFVNAILDSGTHWLKRPIVPNQLREGVDLFA